jgi:hypothetical protein
MSGQLRTACGQLSGQWQEGGQDRTTPFRGCPIVRPCLSRLALEGIGQALRYAHPLPEDEPRSIETLLEMLDAVPRRRGNG